MPNPFLNDKQKVVCVHYIKVPEQNLFQTDFKGTVGEDVYPKGQFINFVTHLRGEGTGRGGRAIVSIIHRVFIDRVPYFYP